MPKAAKRKGPPRKSVTRKRPAGKPSGDQRVERDYRTLFYRKLTENHLFYEVGRMIASETEPVELIQKIIAVIKKEISFEDAGVYIVKKDMTGLDPLSCTGPLFRDISLDLLFFDNGGAPGLIASTGEPLFLPDTALFDGFLHYPDERSKPGSYMGIALKSENRVIGIMGFSHSAAGAFRVEEFDTLRTLSHLISAGFEKAELFKKTLELARVDELTGLLNYRVLMEKLEDEVRRQVRTGREFAFIMIDIDDFKRINDRYGHLEGSRLIAQMGGLLKAACRTDSTDTCFRYGGEEFSILLAEASVEEAEAVAERIRQSVEEYPFTVKVAHPNEKITISLGVSSRMIGEQKSMSKIIEEADIALYHSKAAGKNKVTCYSQGSHMPMKAETGHGFR